MNEPSLTATRFKAQCLAILDEVASSGHSVIVTKHGRAVARVVPIEPLPSLKGSVTFNVDDDELTTATTDDWDALAR